MEAFARAGEHPIYCLRSRGDAPRAGGLYISAGIHGDEPAAPTALALWAETRLAALASRLPVMILPCLNPWGLVNNQRTDARGRDLNRLFDRDDVPPIRELKRLLTGWRFGFVLNLHEDYDAQGIYGYELHGRPPDWGPPLLKACSKIIPIDPRRNIEGRPFKNGLMIRRRQFERIPLHPENIYFHLRGYTQHSMTFETPSEFSLARRVRAHVLLIEECARRLLAQASRTA